MRFFGEVQGMGVHPKGIGVDVVPGRGGTGKLVVPPNGYGHPAVKLYRGHHDEPVFVKYVMYNVVPSIEHDLVTDIDPEFAIRSGLGKGKEIKPSHQGITEAEGKDIVGLYLAFHHGIVETLLEPEPMVQPEFIAIPADKKLLIGAVFHLISVLVIEFNIGEARGHTDVVRDSTASAQSAKENGECIKTILPTNACISEKHPFFVQMGDVVVLKPLLAPVRDLSSLPKYMMTPKGKQYEA